MNTLIGCSTGIKFCLYIGMKICEKERKLESNGVRARKETERKKVMDDVRSPSNCEMPVHTKLTHIHMNRIYILETQSHSHIVIRYKSASQRYQ